MKSQFVISSINSEWGVVRRMPFVFTEHGVTMLSSVLRSDVAMLIGKKSNISVTIYTSEKNCKITEQESKSFNSQYGPLDIKFTDESHDRFLLLDEKELYHT